MACSASAWPLATDGREVHLTFQVHNEAITIPESIDAIRAMTGLEQDAGRSIDKTDRALGLVKSFLPNTVPEATAHAAMARE
jgi:glyceraldehyde-3-phosphate dehydrogenase (NAD(P))